MASIPNTVARKLNIQDIIKEYGIRLMGFIRKRVNSTEDAEDILQEVYYQLAEAETLMKPIDNITSWMFTVARNRIIDLYRKKKTQPLPEYDETTEDYVVEEISELMYDGENSPENEYLRSLIWKEFQKALAELPQEQREVFEMNELQGISFNEISEKTGVPVNTLLSRKRYAVLYLREKLQIWYDELLNF
jgi:RNA polymerase sigma factor (sigma-70 family)